MSSRAKRGLSSAVDISLTRHHAANTLQHLVAQLASHIVTRSFGEHPHDRLGVAAANLYPTVVPIQP